MRSFYSTNFPAARKFLIILLLILAVLGLANCGGSDHTGPSDEPVTFLVNGDTAIIVADTSAGGQIPITFQILEVFGDEPVPMEVRFSANHGTFSALRDTTDGNFEISTVWTLGSTVGAQSFLAEFYRLSDGQRLIGYGQEFIVGPGEVYSVPLLTDSLVMFVGESYPLLSHINGPVTDSFGNVRAIGSYSITNLAGSWTISADTVHPNAPTVTGLVLSAGLFSDTIGVRAHERYLLLHSFTFSYGCNGNPPSIRGSDGAVVGYDVLSTGNVFAVVQPGDSLYKGTFGGTYQLVLDEVRQYTYTDSVVQNQNIREWRAVTAWRPDTVTYEGAEQGLRNGTTVQGGSWCSRVFSSATTAVPAVLTQQ